MNSLLLLTAAATRGQVPAGWCADGAAMGSVCWRGPDALPWRPGDPTANATIPLKEGVAYLRNMLQMAIEVEHSTVPPYLSALYSVKDASSWPADILRNTAIEEMLHMTVACNVLNAVGGHPNIDRPGFVPDYPMVIPLVNVTVGIAPLTRESAHAFRLVERPAVPTGPFVYAADGRPVNGHINESIAVFYEYAIGLMTRLVEQHGERAVFTGDPALQVAISSPTVNEEVRKVLGLKDASEMLLEVVEQGAGLTAENVTAGPLGGKVAHFARFEELYNMRLYLKNDTTDSGPTGPPLYVDWGSMYQFQPNPDPARYPEGSAARTQMEAFADHYTEMLAALHNVFNGQPETYPSTLGTMYELRDMARELMMTPDPRYGPEAHLGLGPPFIWRPGASRYAGGWEGITL